MLYIAVTVCANSVHPHITAAFQVCVLRICELVALFHSLPNVLAYLAECKLAPGRARGNNTTTINACCRGSCIDKGAAVRRSVDTTLEPRSAASWPTTCISVYSVASSYAVLLYVGAFRLVRASIPGMFEIAFRSPVD